MNIGRQASCSPDQRGDNISRDQQGYKRKAVECSGNYEDRKAQFAEVFSR